MNARELLEQAPVAGRDMSMNDALYFLNDYNDWLEQVVDYLYGEHSGKAGQSTGLERARYRQGSA